MPHTVMSLEGQIVSTGSGLAIKISGGRLDFKVLEIPRSFLKDPSKLRPSTSVTVVVRVDESGNAHIMGIKPIASVPNDSESEPTASEKVVVTSKVETAPKRENMTADGIDYGQYVKTFGIVDKLAKTYGKAALFFVGKSGFGKTSMARALAEHTNRKYVRINCAAVRDPEEWFGIREARDGSTTFEPTQFSEALSYGDTVICLDEVNRLEPWLLNALFPLLDDDGATEIHGKRFEVAKNTVFVMTINVGWQYTGVFQLDEAFSNRADLVVKVGRLSITAESEVLRALGLGDDDASRIVKVAMKLESVVTTDCSTRATRNIAKLVVAGMTIKEAFEAVIISRLDESETKQAWDIVNAS